MQIRIAISLLSECGDSAPLSFLSFQNRVSRLTPQSAIAMTPAHAERSTETLPIVREFDWPGREGGESPSIGPGSAGVVKSPTISNQLHFLVLFRRSWPGDTAGCSVGTDVWSRAFGVSREQSCFWNKLMGRVKAVRLMGNAEGGRSTLMVLARCGSLRSSNPPPVTPPRERTQMLSVSAFRINLAGTLDSLVQQTYGRTRAAVDRRYRPPIILEPILNPTRKRGRLSTRRVSEDG